MGCTVGVLAAKFGLSRSTLLYYDSIGLLAPAYHSKGEYRIYGGEEEKRLAQICKYRRAGLSLEQIKKILDSPESGFAEILHQRFEELNKEIHQRYEQQRLIAGLLEKSDKLIDSEVMTKKRWVLLLTAAGYSEKDMQLWHIRFEQTAPEKHLQFLRYLRIDEEEIALIRSWADEHKGGKNHNANDNHY